LNNDGTWGDEISLDVRVLPPWWRTWRAYLIYSGIMMCLIYVAYSIFSKTNKLSNELKIQKIEREKEEEINQIKLKFFTNISHEFRTPLTLILGPIETLLEKTADLRWKEQLLMMKTNSERLLRLVNQILDFRKIEAQKMTLELSYGDIVPFVRNVYDSFLEHARKHDVKFDFFSTHETVYTMFDKDKTERILYNILSNAFKYTPDGEDVSVSVSLDDELTPNVLSIAVSDTGLGIDVGDQQYIFDRFYQGKNRVSDQYKGTGIGLMLSKEFAELQGGDLTFESETGKGSTFTFRMPVVDKEDHPETKENDLAVEAETEESKDKVSLKFRILIVEDDEDLLHYIVLSLEDEFKVLQAKDGLEAWEITKRRQPDLIVSDLMMPNINGVELCKKIKSELDNPVPFILLTAKQDEQSVYDSFECGADAFIVKPFSIKLLKLRINKLIEKEKKMHQYYKNLMLLSPANMVVESQDEKLVMKLVGIVEEHLDNSDMDVEFLCKMSGFSHQQVYRKIRSLTGFTVTKFIRTIRLKRAAQLMEDSKISVSEIMYLAGFTGLSYFSKCFLEQYGKTPKEYMKEKRINKE
jgi:signal transduction histidine kinase/DNA-binding response OmpR family regulator